jgi:integrase
MPSIQKRPSGQWRARYRDPEGKEHARHFDRKADAQRWLDQVTSDLVRGTYVDPKAGQLRFGTFAQEWLAAQTFDVSTHEAVELRLRVHILPTFGKLELKAIRPSTVQAWLRDRQAHCAATHVRVLLANLSTILSAAVDDGLLARNPCESRSVRAAKVEQNKVVPWTADQVAAVVDAHPERYQAVPIVAAGCGLRQGEVFGLRVEDVDFLRRKVLVRQQVKLVKSRPVIAPPKGGKTREVPLPDAVAEAISEQVRRFPSGESGLVFVTREHKPLVRTYYNPHIWKKALRAASVDPTRENGMHALRHFYASVLLDAGESIRALADYLGHSDPGFTLRVYTHLMPSSEDRARTAMDKALRSAIEDPADSSRTRPQFGQ